MEIMIISVLAMVLIFLAFITGLYYGTKIRNNEKIEINPVKMIKEHKEEKKLEEKINKEQIIEDINLENIDNYNGTELGQKEFPQS